jgi:xanthine dehydrogenase accessory factor
MKEMQSIIDAYKEVQRTDTPSALATVVNVTGSAYRRPGARMLIRGDGRTVGSVSGGCLERDVMNQARRVLQWNEPRVVTYNSMSDDDVAWEFNLGCNGIVDVLIEPLSPTAEPGHLAFIAECLRHRKPGVVAAVFSVEGDTKARVGNRLLLAEQLPVQHDIEDGDFIAAILDDARRALADGTSRVKRYDLAVSRAEVFIEVIQPPVPLVIFGAGHDAVPLVRLAKELGWHVTLIDPRPGFATRTRFPLADQVIVCRPDEVFERATIDGRTVAAVMTHNFLHDAELLSILVPSPVRYIGILGAKQRTRQLLDHVQETIRPQSDPALGRVYGPIGLDIGAETPEEIALAIVAEIKAVLKGRVGGVLRSRQGPLHEPSEAVDVGTGSGKIKGMVYCGHA